MLSGGAPAGGALPVLSACAAVGLTDSDNTTTHASTSVTVNVRSFFRFMIFASASLLREQLSVALKLNGNSNLCRKCSEVIANLCNLEQSPPNHDKHHYLLYLG
jgi:hypothetical protein